ncbi:rhodanese-like domain-containing protein [Methylomarinum sp. Ch1-1]|uniref:Rhodanese-like domain-containing protein n=1 Tax=Methylomarinum roseum TaxID=3067653 RepID=A0AAU7NVV3_9GAMM|nr:rhodanese-like domain-containing protein [Methylomarinum sp. Ch1-1]MDP4522881.1 rhodanese-like domain-containing protein [Methylomarinum sp. Ch1-1]
MIENLNPKQCWRLMQDDPAAVIVDVRTAIEHSFVGHPLGAIPIAWKEFPGMQLNTAFVEQVKQAVPDKQAPVLLLCRSGQRSLDAAKALEAEGYQHLVNIVEGFEGPLDEHKHRGNLGGWRFHGLPWEQS